MLHSISWEIYLTTLAVVLISYYAITTLLLYYPEIIALLKSAKNDSPATPPSKSTAESPMLMGNIRVETTQDVRSSLVNAEEITAAPSGNQEEPDAITTTTSNTDAVDRDTLLIGIVADLLQDLHGVLHAMNESKLTAEEAAALLTTLVQRYTQLRNTPFREAINLYILEQTRDRFPQWSHATTNTWWNNTETEHNT